MMSFFDKFKKKKNETFSLTENEMKQYENFITTKFGEIKGVMHEIYSPDIHVDIIVVGPTEEHNYYKLITMGMSSYKMEIPDELKKEELERAELIFYLPPDWNINSEKEEDYWPIRILKTIARTPLIDSTWVGIGHTFSNDEDSTYYADNTEFCSTLLLHALDYDYKKLDFRLNGKDKVNFYQLYPIYEEELQFKIKNGSETLLGIIDDEDLFPILNINRKKYCIKRSNNN